MCTWVNVEGVAKHLKKLVIQKSVIEMHLPFDFTMLHFTELIIGIVNCFV